jgi:hypothetical protein
MGAGIVLDGEVVNRKFRIAWYKIYDGTEGGEESSCQFGIEKGAVTLLSPNEA